MINKLQNNMTGIVILNYNDSEDIRNCIDSIYAYVNVSDFKIIVVDNGSKEEVRSTVKDYLSTKDKENCQYIQLNENIGYARGNNVGIDIALNDDEIENIIILNPDIIFTQDLITPFKKFASEHPEAGAISSLLYRVNGTIDEWCARRILTPSELKFAFSFLFSSKYRAALHRLLYICDNPGLLKLPFFEIDQPSGSCMFFKKEVLKKIGGFDPNTFLYYEEAILHKKLKDLGKINYLLPQVSCIHVSGSTTNKTQVPYFLKKCNYDSLLYYMRTYTSATKFQIAYLVITGNLLLWRLQAAQKYRNLKNKLKK